MLRIGQVEATATQDGKYTDGSVAGGIAATRLRAAAFNAMQEELAHIVESAGLVLDINDMTQVLKAIQKLTLSRANPFADIKSDGAAAISTALSNLGLIGGVIPNKIGRLVNIKIINTSGTYTRSPQATFGYVEVIGAGGAGAGSPGINNTTDINYSVVGSGGGAGAYAFKFYQELPVTAPVIVGVGGQATYATGNPGGASSFNSSIVAYGGAGGSYIGAYYTNSVITNVRGPSGGSAVGGDINAAGEMGGSCFVSNNLNVVSGKGGASKLGSGGISVGGGSANGVPSSTPGGGGSGAVSSRDSLVAAPAQLGGAGANGIVIVWEFA
ncbi:MAG: hypothetical protein LKI37_14825 [Citrobacter freundii]|jgi:hypothetical protein|nr:hypothetical protein [Citrobacter freundii]MCI1828634.1 hypothetical protein [Citrobacter freundii]